MRPAPDGSEKVPKCKWGTTNAETVTTYMGSEEKPLSSGLHICTCKQAAGGSGGGGSQVAPTGPMIMAVAPQERPGAIPQGSPSPGRSVAIPGSLGLWIVPSVEPSSPNLSSKHQKSTGQIALH
jgi:hypothetical protein